MGWVSSTFPVEAGIRQGCPFSPLAFILALELFAIKLRADRSVKGLALPHITSAQALLLKLTMYADDMSLYLKDKTDAERILSLVYQFSLFSGLEINRHKSELMWLGSAKNNNEDLFGIKSKKKIKILGVFFSNATPAASIEENWEKRLEKVSRLTALWTKRNLSIAGKICVVKSLLLSQFTYIMQALVIPKEVLARLNTIIFRFIWKKKFSNTRAFEKVKRSILCKDYGEGGLKMINVTDMQISFLLSWALKLQNNISKWTQIPRYYFNQLGSLSCFQSDLKSKMFAGTSLVKNPFWKQVLLIWLDYKSRALPHKEVLCHFKDETIWNNKLVTYRGKTLFFRDWAKAQVFCVRDVWPEVEMKSFEQICQTVGYKPTRLFEYNAVRTALKVLQSRCHNEHLTRSCYQQELSRTYTAKQIRENLVESGSDTSNAIKFWSKKLGITISKNHWNVVRLCTSETRLRLLHWKIISNIYPTNILLSKMGIKLTNRCDFCSEIDFVEHFFWSCPKVRPVWKAATDLIYKKLEVQVSLTMSDVLFGYQINNKNSRHRLINHIIIIAKMCVGMFRYGKRLDLVSIFEREIETRSRFLW